MGGPSQGISVFRRFAFNRLQIDSVFFGGRRVSVGADGGATMMDKRRIPLKVAIPAGLRKNREKLGQPDGPMGDFIRLVKVKQLYVDRHVEGEIPAVEWVGE
jgi:hypothetical protein